MIDKKIGIIGGLAFRAGVHYYEQLLNRCNEKDSVLRLILTHASINTVLPLIGAGDKAKLGTYLGSLANELFDAGVDSVSISAIAPHIAIDEIRNTAKGPIISALDTVEQEIKAQKLDKVAVFGNRSVMESGIYGAIQKNVVVNLRPTEQERVHEMYTEIALEGKRGTKPESEYLSNLANELISRDGVQAIVLAGTDLSSFYSEQPPDFPFLDMAKLHVEQIVSSS